MVHTCAFINCKEKFKKGGASFYSFPKNKELRKKWLLALRQNNTQLGEHAKLCSKHFTDDCFEIAPWSRMKMLRPNSVPTLFVFGEQKEFCCSKDVQSGDTNDIRSPDVICAVKYCRNKVQSYSDRVLNFTSFFHFPEIESVRSKWLHICGLENSDINLETAVVCDVHFRPEDFLDELPCTPSTLSTQKKLCHRAVPSRFLRTENIPRTRVTSDSVTQQFKESLQDKFSALILKEKNYLDAGICNEDTLEASKLHTVHDIVLPEEVPKVCFICNELVLLQAVPLRYGLTHFSSTALPMKLGQLVGEGFLVIVADSDVLCTTCFNLLNCLDKMELELCVIRNVVSGFLKSKYHLNQVCDGLTLESLQTLNDQLDEIAKLGNTSEKCKFGFLEHQNREAIFGSGSTTSATTQQLNNLLSKRSKEPDCVEEEAKHVKFLDTFVSDRKHVDWAMGDVQNHVIVVHDYNDSEVIDDVAELFVEKNVYTCELCGHEDSVKDAYIIHLRQHKNNNYYKCKLCSRKFATKEFLRKHERSHKPFKCTSCSEIFMLKVDFLSHLRCHKNALSEHEFTVSEAKNTIRLDV